MLLREKNAVIYGGGGAIGGGSSGIRQGRRKGIHRRADAGQARHCGG